MKDFYFNLHQVIPKNLTNIDFSDYNNDPINIIYRQIILSVIITMQETIKFLGAIDSRLRRQSLHSTPKNSQKVSNKFPYAKVMQFEEGKFTQYPKWLTEREDFLKFMYQNYEQKLLTIPKICLKQNRASDQKYFISLYLRQLPMFQQLPPLVMDILLNQIKTHKYKTGDVIHQESQIMQFMAVIFVGSVQFQRNEKKICKIKNDVIMTQAFYEKTHQKIIAKQQTVLLTLHRQVYLLIQDKLLAEINEKQRDQIADLIKSDFFIQLHLKDSKARSFFENMKLQFYFKGQTVSQAGQLPKKFHLIFKGSVWQQNHIYIRQHNKWPLPHRRWQVRAVYNSFESTQVIGRHNFFGDEQIINALRLKSSHIAKSHTILFSMYKDQFIDSLSTEDFKRLKKYRNEHVNVNYTEFQKSVRDRVKSRHQRKKIVHKAIDASFNNRRQFPHKKMSLIQNLERHMTNSIDVQHGNSQNIKPNDS